MDVDAQWLVNGLFGLLMFTLGYILNGVRMSVRDLQHQDQMLADKVQRIEVLVAGKYITRNEFDLIANRIFGKLEDISRQIDGKADK